MHTEGQEGPSARVPDSPEGARDYRGGTIGHHPIRWPKIRPECPVLAGAASNWDRDTPRVSKARGVVRLPSKDGTSRAVTADIDGKR